MSVFRLQSNVPDIYVDESRDFQLFCRLYDCIFDGVKFDIDSMLNILDTRSCNNMLLQLLQSKVGFFTTADITSDELRVIIDAFPVIMKNKGSLTGVKQAINTFLKVKKLKTGAYINIINEVPYSISNDELNAPYVLNIGIEADIQNTNILDILFYYILPTGYTINYYFYSETVNDEKWVFNDSNYRLIFSNPYTSDSVEITPQVVIASSLPEPNENVVGKIYAILDADTGKYTKYYCDYDVSKSTDTHIYMWKPVSADDYRSATKLGLTEVSKFYPLTDNSNMDTYKILELSYEDLERYRKSEAVCGYYYNGNFYSDSEHHNIITPISESNKLCYYDIPTRNYYVYTSSFNTATEGTTPKYVLIVHEEDINE